MKKRKFGKLKLNRETLLSLDNENLSGVAGGASYPDPNCNSIPEFLCGPDSGVATECHTAVGCGTSGAPICASIPPACTPVSGATAC